MTTASTHFPDRARGVHVRGGHAAGKAMENLTDSVEQVFRLL